MYPRKILLIATIFISKLNADDYASNEEMTASPGVDFFDGENSEELFDPVRQQADKGFQEFVAMSQRTTQTRTTTADTLSSSEEDNNSRHMHNTRQSILTTVVPDYIQSYTPTAAAAAAPPPAVGASIEGINEAAVGEPMMLNDNPTKYLDENDTISSSSMDFGVYSDRNYQNHQQSSTIANDNNYSSSSSSTSTNHSAEDTHMLYNFDDDHINNSNNNNSGDDDLRLDTDGDQYEPATTTLISPTIRTKQAKQIQIIKLLPHEALRNFIEDFYIRSPLAALVDTSPNSLPKTKALWKDALRANAAMDIVLLAFNTSGVGVTYSFKNTRTLLAGLNSIKESDQSTSGGNAFFGIIRASELVPYDSAVFINTASIPADTNLAQYAAITLLKKRIRLYLVWFGEKAFSENETQEVTGGVLGEVAIRSGGEILHVDDSNFQMDADNTLTLVSKNFLQGPQEVEIPVETSISDLHIKIDSLMRTATLETPNGG